MELPQLSHPFKNNREILSVPDNRIQDVDEIMKWLKEQPRFPQFNANHAHLFLHACLWNIADTKKAFTKYCHLRTSSPDVFGNRDVLLPEIENVFTIAEMVEMPHATNEGYKILIYRLRDTDTSKVHFANAIKGFCMFNDVRISEDLIVNGYVVVFDMKGLRLGHLARVQFGPLRTFMAYIQEAHPVRLKKIYIVNTASFINQIMALIKPLIKSELMSLLHFTPGGPSDIIPLELLPEDYGGPLPSMATFHAEQKLDLENYRSWLIESGYYKELPAPAVVSQHELKTQSQSVICSGPSAASKSPPVILTESFSRLEID